MRLAECAQGGDRAAFNELARHHRPLLFALAFLRTSHREEAEDLVQEVLLRAWQSLPTLQDPRLFLPWLKAIAANAYTSWHRRARSVPAALGAEATATLIADKGRPLELLLQRERQRELHQALLALPEANRVALLMYAWGGASYEDIAAAAGVPATTVEGRIYRARRQLGRLLRDATTDQPGDTRRPRAERGHTVSRTRGETMTPTQPHTDQTHAASPDHAQPPALALFTRRLSSMIDAGISITRALDVLTEAPPPYGQEAREIAVKVEAGATLSEAMSDRPDLFSAPYVLMVRAGEVGGILEETLQRMVKVMTKEWQLARRRPSAEEPLLLLHPTGTPYPQDWAGLSPYQRTVTLVLFFETFAMLLQSGVPILRTMDTLTPLLPPTQRAGWAQVRQLVTEGEPMISGMERMGIFPRFALAMTSVGEVAGTLHTIFYRLSEAFEDDLNYAAAPAESG